MDNNQSEKECRKESQLPPPPPPIASLNMPPPVISEHSYSMYHDRKHLQMLNGETEYSTQKEEVEAKLKKEFTAAEGNCLQSESTGETITRNTQKCQKCLKCDFWIEKDEMKLHLSFHVAPVFPNLLLGDKHSSSSEKELFIRNKVTHVLNAAAQIKNRFEDRGVLYLQLALEDRIGEEIVEEAIKGAEFINKVIEEGGIIFVHCALGQSRSVSCIIMYLMMFRGMNYEDSLTLIRVTRPIAKPNISYTSQLRQFSDKTFKK